MRPGDRNPELRYSLRSLHANLPHDRLWIAGYAPRWVRRLEYLPVGRRATKYETTSANVRAACECDEVSDPFILMNDDFYVMQPAPCPPMANRGTVLEVAGEYVRMPTYRAGMLATLDVVAAALEVPHDSVLCYELHVPLLVYKAQMLAALDMGREVPAFNKRTAYGNLLGLGGVRQPDVKVSRHRRAWSREWPYLSTDGWSFNFHEAGQYVRRTFREPSPYEDPEVGTARSPWAGPRQRVDTRTWAT